MLTGSNTQVGLAEGIQGVCQLLAAFPAGLLSDRFRRDRVLKSAAVIGQLAVLTIIVALFSGEILGQKDGGDYTMEFTLMCFGLGIKQLILSF